MQRLAYGSLGVQSRPSLQQLAHVIRRGGIEYALRPSLFHQLAPWNIVAGFRVPTGRAMIGRLMPDFAVSSFSVTGSGDGQAMGQ